MMYVSNEDIELLKQLPNTFFFFKYMPWLQCWAYSASLMASVCTTLKRLCCCSAVSTLPGASGASGCSAPFRMGAECAGLVALGPCEMILTLVTLPPLPLTWLPETLLMWGSTLLRKVGRSRLCLCLCSWNVREFGTYIFFMKVRSLLQSVKMYSPRAI